MTRCERAGLARQRGEPDFSGFALLRSIWLCFMRIGSLGIIWALYQNEVLRVHSRRRRWESLITQGMYLNARNVMNVKLVPFWIRGQSTEALGGNQDPSSKNSTCIGKVGMKRSLGLFRQLVSGAVLRQNIRNHIKNKALAPFGSRAILREGLMLNHCFCNHFDGDCI